VVSLGFVILRDRQRKILRFLNGNQVYMTGQALSERLGISARTVRSDIVEINRCIDPTVAKIIAYRSKGYEGAFGKYEGSGNCGAGGYSKIYFEGV